MRLDKSALDPVVVRTLMDIKRLLGELDPRHTAAGEELPLNTIMTGHDETGRAHQYVVHSRTKSRSRRDMLVEGMEIVKSRLEAEQQPTESAEVEVDGKTMRPASLQGSTSGHSWVDAFIKQWLGGYRDKLHICWDLGDGYVYRYDIFQHKLSRIQR
jgi:hypothetical protein